MSPASPERERAENGTVHTLALELALRRVGEVVRDKESVVRLAFVGLLARGHLLLEDVPGVGKTTLARALAKAVGGEFTRIQMTSDLLPADILGGQRVNHQSGELELRKGPIFAHVVLADELNRATPRTQSGLLEAMAERSVSIDGRTHSLPDPFMVIATQNPAEHHGVYPLPESQLDRFLLRTSLGYPGEAIERELLQRGSGSENEDPVAAMEPALSPVGLRQLAAEVDRVFLGDEVASYLQAIVRATRSSAQLETGVSTRGAIFYARAVRARALLEGRRFVNPDDVHSLAVAVCAHRVVVRGARRIGRLEAEGLIEALVRSVPVPV